MIFPENMDLRVYVPERPAIEEQGQLGDERDTDGDDRGQMKGRRIRVGSSSQIARGENNQDPRDGCHEEAEDNVARRFDPGLSRRESPRVNRLDGAIADDEGHVRHGVEDGVRHGRE